MSDQKLTVVCAIDYDEGDQSSYRAVCLDKMRFATGDPEQDYQDAMQYYIHQYPDKILLFSSSVDNFAMDGDQFTFNEDEYIVAI